MEKVSKSKTAVTKVSESSKKSTSVTIYPSDPEQGLKLTSTETVKTKENCLTLSIIYLSNKSK